MFGSVRVASFYNLAKKPLFPFQKEPLIFQTPLNELFVGLPPVGICLQKYSFAFLLVRIFRDSVKHFQGNGTNLLSKKITNEFALSKQTNQNYDWTFSGCTQSPIQVYLIFCDEWIFPGAHFMHFVDCRLPEPTFLGLITPFNNSFAFSSITNINMEPIYFLFLFIKDNCFDFALHIFFWYRILQKVDIVIFI